MVVFVVVVVVLVVVVDVVVVEALIDLSYINYIIWLHKIKHFIKNKMPHLMYQYFKKV